jgi:hypothetical protein
MVDATKDTKRDKLTQFFGGKKLDHGSGRDAKDRNGMAPLHLPVARGYVPAVATPLKYITADISKYAEPINSTDGGHFHPICGFQFPRYNFAKRDVAA